MSLEDMKVHVRPEWRKVSLEHITVPVWRLLCPWKISQCLQEDYSVLGTYHSACMEAIVPLEDITVPTGRL